MSHSPERAPEPPKRKEDQIYVGKLSRHTREDTLKKEFEKCGAVTEVLLKNGYAFMVSFYRQ